MLKICITDITAVQNDNEYLLNHICPLCERQKNTLCKKMTNLSLNHHILWLILVFTPYYAIINDENNALYAQYKNMLNNYPNFYLLGRLAEYKYYNIDGIVDKALGLADRLLGRVE